VRDDGECWVAALEAGREAIEAVGAELRRALRAGPNPALK
jgi:hypothetical protein